MARAESKMIMGYLPIVERHYSALLSLVAPATPAVKLLDPFAGEGAFLEAAAKAWNVTPYANELDGERAAACIVRFGATQAVRCDVERLVASNNAFGAAWLNPPYDHDAGLSGSKRVEFRYLRHAWKWVQDGGLTLWCIYRQHITSEAAAFLAKHSSRVDVWALPGKHLGEYDQMIVVAVKGVPLNPAALYEQIIRDRDNPQSLTVQPEPIYRLTAPRAIQRFVFAPDLLDEVAGLALIQEQGAWKTGGFQSLLEVPPPPTEIEPVVAPRPGHLALVLAAGVADGAVIETAEYGQVAIRGKTRHVEQIARVEVEADPNDPERQVKKTTIRLKPTTTLTLLGADGTSIEMEGDEALLGFITSNKRSLAQYLNAKFQPMYRFDMNGIGRWLDSIRLKGKHKLYTAQKHVIAAVTRGLQDRDSILLIGQMGVGKAQSLDAKVLTPTGWKRMGNIGVGDPVINPSGGIARVVGVYPQGSKAMYRVTFSDGSATECCQEHLWLVNTPYRKWAGAPARVKPLGDLMRQGLLHTNGNYRHFIPMVQPVDFPLTPLPVDPYVLGILIGDGSISNKNVKFSSGDAEIVEAVQRLVAPGWKVKHLQHYDYIILCGRQRLANGYFARHPFKEALTALGLMGKRAEHKFIPDVYRFAGLDDRMALMQGLFDADACVASPSKSGIEFTTVSAQLAENVQELVWSMGGRATLRTVQPHYTYKDEKRQGQRAYRLYITLPPSIRPFRLSRKADAYTPGTKYHPTRPIVRVTPIGMREAQCIALDSANQLYVTDDYIVTHNTALGGAASIAIASHIATAFQGEMRSDQVTLIVAPPHLIDKWKRELVSIAPKAFIQRLDRHEEVRQFMSRVETVGSTVPKIGLIKRDLTKLGCPWEPSVIWRNEAVALWRFGASVPDGYLPQQRIRRERVPKCPHCGSVVMQEKKGVSAPASQMWLEGGKRTCAVCQSPLWRESRDRGAQPKPGEKYPPKNPRYRLDEYLKRMYPDRVFLLIWDEVHEAQHSDTGNGEAFNRMAGMAKKTLAMTGTPFNGRSSSIFNLEYAINPRMRDRYNWGGARRFDRKERGGRQFQAVISESTNQRGRAESRWVSEMGVREQVVEERPSYDRDTGAYTGTSTYERPYQEAPGISPLLVAEVLDHAIFFSLGDLGKALPQYEEIALPVELDPDVYAEYDRTRARLKDYLIQRRWEGDATFRGAYLQWSMGWVNAPFRPYEVIHNLKHPITGAKEPYTVASIPSYGDDRIFAKEQALIDLVRAELTANRPCVIYFRQTATRDIQPRLESLLRQHVPEVRTFILKNTVDAERREAVIEREIAKGTNVVLCNPELVKTGLDLIHFPTLIFYELVFNLSTLMQAAARSYRLNQKHEHCKVYYLFAEGTMEQTAVQLMSRKQRAAKLLTGDIGLTGLDALTEGEGGFEEALLEAIGRDETLLDPSQLFKAASAVSEIDAEDAGYWNVDGVETTVEELLVEEADPLIALALELGGTVTPIPSVSFAINEVVTAKAQIDVEKTLRPVDSVTAYLETVHLIADDAAWQRLRAELLLMLDGGTQTQICGWLTEHRIVFPGCEAEVAAKIIMLATSKLEADSQKREPPHSVAAPKRKREPERQTHSFPRREPVYEEALTQQLALF